MKTFYTKILTIMAILVGILISLNYYYRYKQNKNFQIINERQSVIIQLPNTEYIEIASRNDHVSNNNDFSSRPFSINTKIQKNSNLENSVARTETYIEYIENGDMRREIVITPIDSKNLEVKIYAETQYIFLEGLKYNIQMDYSNKTAFKEDAGYLFFEDKGCRVEIYDELLDYNISENEQSIILSRDYTFEVEYDIKLNIVCKN